MKFTLINLKDLKGAEAVASCSSRLHTLLCEVGCKLLTTNKFFKDLSPFVLGPEMLPVWSIFSNIQL